MNSLPFKMYSYHLEDVVGIGNSANRTRWPAVVFRAQNIHGFTCAYKLMVVKDELKFMRETEKLKQLVHENVIRVLDSFVLSMHTALPRLPCISAEHRGVLIMELGHWDFGHWCKYYNRFKPFTNLMMFRGIIEGMKYLHSCKIMHGDVKPENIILDSRNVPKLADFGLSNADGDMIVGHSRYSSPEARNGQEYVYESDIFSLGLILMQLFTEHHSFYAWLHKENYSTFSYITETDPDLSFPERNLMDPFLMTTVTRVLKVEIAERIPLQDLINRIDKSVNSCFRVLHIAYCHANGYRGNFN